MTDVSTPSGEERSDESTGAGCGIQQAHHAWAPAEEAGPESGKDGPGHAEDHGVEIDHVASRQEPLALEVAEPFGHGAQAHRGPSTFRHQGREQKHGNERHPEGGHINGVDGGETDGCDQDASQGRAHHQGKLEDRGLQRDGVGHGVASHQHGKGSPTGWPIDTLESRTCSRADEQGPDCWMSERCVDGQTGHCARHCHLREDQDSTAVPGIGQCPAPQRASQQGDELGQAKKADDQRGVGEVVGLIGDGHQGELTSHPRDDLASPQPTEVGESPERGDVDEQPGHPGTLPAHVVRSGRGDR